MAKKTMQQQLDTEFKSNHPVSDKESRWDIQIVNEARTVKTLLRFDTVDGKQIAQGYIYLWGKPDQPKLKPEQGKNAFANEKANKEALTRWKKQKPDWLVQQRIVLDFEAPDYMKVMEAARTISAEFVKHYNDELGSSRWSIYDYYNEGKINWDKLIEKRKQEVEDAKARVKETEELAKKILKEQER